MAWELHLIFEKCEPAGIRDAEGFCLDEGRDKEEVCKAREAEMRGRKKLVVNIGGKSEEVDVIEVRDRDGGKGVAIRVKHEEREYDLLYCWLHYAD